MSTQALALLLALLALAHGEEGCLLQRLRRLDVEDVVWRNTVDIPAMQGMVWPMKHANYTLRFFSTVPTFGPDGDYIALLHDYDLNLVKHLQQEPLYCSGAGRAHRAKIKLFGQEKGIPLTLHLHCSWPAAEATSSKIEVFLETFRGEPLGRVFVSNHVQRSDPYNAVACVRDLYYMNETGNNFPYKLLPEWIEFQQMHGIEHFYVYTFGKSDPVTQSLLKPHLLSGLVTEIHFQEYPKYHRLRHYRSISDCLHRAKNQATWVMPTVDLDEFFHLNSGKIFPDGEIPQDYLRSSWDAIVRYEGKRVEDVNSISFASYRFDLPPRDRLLISSEWREGALQVDPFRLDEGKEGFPKYVFNVKNVEALYIHWVHSWKAGTVTLRLPADVGVVNHYRAPHAHSPLPAHVSDKRLLKDVPVLEEALRTRYGDELLAQLTDLHPEPEAPSSGDFHAADLASR